MKVITRLLFVIALLLTGVTSAYAANRELKGTVTDTQDEPLVGVSVQVQSTKIAVATDVDGNFKLKVPEGPVTLLISYVGYAPQTKTLSPSKVQW